MSAERRPDSGHLSVAPGEGVALSGAARPGRHRRGAGFVDSDGFRLGTSE